MHPNRISILRDLDRKTPLFDTDPSPPPSALFGKFVFGQEEMKNRLTRDSYTSLVKVISGEEKMTPNLASALADAVKDWALSMGVTHFTHWFQPLTGLTAEKHDSFLSFDKNGKAIEKFSPSQLIQSEPDASSFPSGGTRSTFEARGYTAWDVGSPMFIVEHSGTRVLCIPSVFVSYTGNALDTKTTLLRSIRAINKNALDLLNLMGDSKTENVYVTIGCEQEYFLIDSGFFKNRPDLLLTGRSLLGGDMPKGQQLEDHYFGTIPSRVRAFMAEVEQELYLLGVPVKTRHNEVAPAQFEMAPIFEEANLASDHNMLTMEVLKRVAEKHDFVCLLHEKPFAGVNGSGKHCNWSMSTDRGENLLEPGTTPQSNFRFLAFLSCILHAVNKNQVALRAAIASHGNDHRLGANEAPPAIISVFLGSTLTQVIEALAKGKDLSKLSFEKAHIEFGINQLPSIPKDNTDRNRTSPFAFTGNKFEFRAVGSSQAISLPMTVLNAAVAQSIREFVTRFESRKPRGGDAQTVLLEITREFFIESEKIRFEGDGYSAEWREEARKRGLAQLMTTPDAFLAFDQPENHKFLIESGVFTESEYHALHEIRLERYIKHLDIEAQTLCTLVRQFVIPAAQKYQERIATSIKAVDSLGGSVGSTKNQKWLLTEVSSLMEQAFDGVSRLQNEVKQALELGDWEKRAQAFGSKVAPSMSELRHYCDRLEVLVDDEVWGLPKYREMLFLR